MTTSILSAAHFHNEEAAFAYVESKLWPDGPICPKCGVIGEAGKLKGASTRVGVYKCYACRKPFTVKVGTIFESSHVKLHLWLQAIHLMCSSKKGISSNQLHRTLGITLKSAWFLSHRIREAMKDNNVTPFGTGGGVVEADETFIGREPGSKKGKGGFGHKLKVLTLIDRVTGRAKSLVIDKLNTKTVNEIVHENVAKEARLMTDEARHYRQAGKTLAEHSSVAHQKGEYVRINDSETHINTAEGFYSVFKRGMKGVYQHCGKPHLHRYAREFDFRYSNRVFLGIDDSERAEILLRRVVGKRLTYETTAATV